MKVNFVFVILFCFLNKQAIKNGVSGGSLKMKYIEVLLIANPTASFDTATGTAT